MVGAHPHRAPNQGVHVKFNRLELRAAVSAAIAQDKADQEKYQAKRLTEYETELSEWSTAHADEWLAALPKLRALIRKGLPITSGDLPQDKRYGSRYTAIFGRDRKPAPGTYTPHADLVTMANVLDLLTDEEVTDTALARVGVRSTMIRRMAELIRVDK
jgi:hypothetical protein